MVCCCHLCLCPVPQVFACVSHVLCMLTASMLMFGSGVAAVGFIFLAIAFFMAYFYYSTRDRLLLCARLFGVSATGLTQHPSILTLVVTLWMVLGGVYLAGGGLTFLSMTNGKQREGEVAARSCSAGRQSCCC